MDATTKQTAAGESVFTVVGYGVAGGVTLIGGHADTFLSRKEAWEACQGLAMAGGYKKIQVRKVGVIVFTAVPEQDGTFPTIKAAPKAVPAAPTVPVAPVSETVIVTPKADGDKFVVSYVVSYTATAGSFWSARPNLTREEAWKQARALANAGNFEVRIHRIRPDGGYSTQDRVWSSVTGPVSAFRVETVGKIGDSVATPAANREEAWKQAKAFRASGKYTAVRVWGGGALLWDSAKAAVKVRLPAPANDNTTAA